MKVDQVKYEECDECAGSGICYECDGEGCRYCGRSGDCAECDGTGEVEEF